MNLRLYNGNILTGYDPSESFQQPVRVVSPDGNVEEMTLGGVFTLVGNADFLDDVISLPGGHT